MKSIGHITFHHNNPTSQMEAAMMVMIDITQQYDDEVLMSYDGDKVYVFSQFEPETPVPELFIFECDKQIQYHKD